MGMDNLSGLGEVMPGTWAIAPPEQDDESRKEFESFPIGPKNRCWLESAVEENLGFALRTPDFKLRLQWILCRIVATP